MRLALSAVKWLVFGMMLTHMTSGMGDDIFIFFFLRHLALSRRIETRIDH